ncbi:stathmin domain-containing protein 1 [Anguilla anguilla]|uniref:stathmin domain-containing protein 1 n=1 Tax=Anguilla anguilla TaxID=7936 RepID=UPI0015ABBD97|nr:stathmin domain-containing protein 1 [Anguilla anguilla]
MGCGSSKIRVVSPVERNGFEDAFCKPATFSRGDSAVSKHTTDSGLGLEAGEGASPSRGPLPPLAPPLAVRSSENAERQNSSDILEQLRNQGILLAPPTLGAAGEAYSVTMDSTDKVLQKPPARLQSLKTSKEQTVASMETIEEKMKSVEERRKVKEAELRQRLRSARLRGNPKLKEEEEEEEEEGSSDRAPDPTAPGPCRSPSLQPSDPPNPGLEETQLETDPEGEEF